MTEADEKRGDRVAVVIPVYNHGGAVVAVVRAAMDLGWPVTVVDDGSTDDTPRRLGGIPGIRVIRHPVNQGKGAALVTGFRAVAGEADFAVVMDGDGQHLPGDALALVRAIPDGVRPLVLGRRRGMHGPETPWTSTMGRRFSNLWIRVSGGPGVADSQSGFRVYPLPETLALGVRARRYEFEVEVLVLAHRRGIPVMEVPVGVHYPPRGERVSHFRPFLDSLRNSAVFSRLIFRRIAGLS
jgi:glycosyltransferase involved in cell wall biosynthesis